MNQATAQSQVALAEVIAFPKRKKSKKKASPVATVIIAVDFRSKQVMGRQLVNNQNGQVISEVGQMAGAYETAKIAA